MSSDTIKSKSNAKSRLICSAPGCKNRADNFSFHKFPRANQRIVYITNFFGEREKIDQLEAWKRALKLDVVKTSFRICSNHFTKDDYFFPDLGVKKKQLKRIAIPSLNLPGQNQEKLKLKKLREVRLLARNVDKVIVKDDKQASGVQEAESLSSTAKINEDKSIKNPEKINEEQPLTTLYPLITMKCDTGVQVKTAFFKPKFIDFINNNNELSTMTGIESFHILDKIVDIVTKQFGEQLQRQNTKMNIRDKIIMTYVKLKQNFSYNCIAILFQCYQSDHCRRIFHEMIKILCECLKNIITWPCKDIIMKNLPKCFENFQDTKVILSCTEISIQNPKDRISNSSCKKSQSIKFMTGVTIVGNFSYISKRYDGFTSDKDIFENSDIINLLENGDAIMAHKGFKIDEICKKYCWKLYRTPSPRDKKQLFHENEILDKQKYRKIYMERSCQRIKKFKIVDDRMSSALIPYVEDIVTVICATLNLNLTIVNNDKID